MKKPVKVILFFSYLFFFCPHHFYRHSDGCCHAARGMGRGKETTGFSFRPVFVSCEKETSPISSVRNELRAPAYPLVTLDPMPDLYNTDEPTHRHFFARPVVGAAYMRMLEDRLKQIK